jgi:predicted phage terminase large subunit-like protein
MLSADTIAGFSGSLLQKNFDGAVATPACHYEWWELCCSKERYVAIAAPRRHAKTTAVTTTYTLACLLFRERSYALIVSDTVTQAVQFLGDIKRELSNNDQLRALFKVKEFIKDADDDFICLCEDGHMFRVQAKGSEQKVRGLKWNNKRPDLIVCDDLENDEIVMNKDRREKFRNWFFGALLPCISYNGVVRYVGTILHADSLLERLMPKLYDKRTQFDGLVTWTTKKSAWKSVKYRAHDENMSHFLWEEMAISSAKQEKLTTAKEYFSYLRESFVEQGLSEKYSQEYLNLPIDESFTYYKRKDFLEMRQEDFDKSMRFYITGDLAISESERADYSVFLVAGIDEHRNLYVRDIIRDRMDGREIVDTILALEKAWRPEVIGIEEMQVSKAIGPFLREEMARQNVFPSLLSLKHGGKDKHARAKSMQARTRTHTVRFNKEADWYQDFEDEVCTFPRARNDDQFDALAYLGMLLDIVIEAPTENEIAEEEYLDELRESESDGSSGRNSFTGY